MRTKTRTTADIKPGTFLDRADRRWEKGSDGRYRTSSRSYSESLDSLTARFGPLRPDGVDARPAAS